MFVGVAVGTVVMRMQAHKSIGSALKQPRIKPVLCSLPQFEQRRGLRDVGNGQVLASRQNGLRPWRQPMLQRLRFHRADNASRTAAATRPRRC